MRSPLGEGLLLSCSFLLSATAPPAPDSPRPGTALVGELTPGATLERETNDSSVDGYRVRLDAGQFLMLAVDQRGFDAVVRLLDPAGGLVHETDVLNHPMGSEPASFLAESSGDYRLEVRRAPGEARSRQYRIRVGIPRPPTPADHDRLRAEKALREAGTLVKQGDGASLKKAAEVLSGSLPVWEALGERPFEALAHLEIGRAQAALGQHLEALAHDEKALALYQSLAEPIPIALALHRRGEVLYFLGRSEQAKADWEQALPLWRAAGDRLGEAETLANTSLVLRRLGESPRALEVGQEALGLLRALGNRESEAATLNALASIHAWRGSFQQALDLFSQAREINRELGSREGEATNLMNAGVIHELLGDPSGALAAYEAVLPIWRTLGHRRGEAATLGNMGDAFFALGEIDKALESYEASRERQSAAADRAGEAGSLIRIAHCQAKKGDRTKALTLHLRALEILREVRDRLVISGALLSLGELRREMGALDEAVKCYDEARSLARELGNARDEATALYYLARVDRDRGELAAGRQKVEAALGIVETLRGRVQNQKLRTSFSATVRRMYELAIDILMQLHSQQPSAGLDREAFLVSERGRARNLLEMLGESGVDVREGVAPGLLAEKQHAEEILSLALDRQARLLAGAPAQAEAAAKDVQRLSTAYAEVQARIRAAAPRYATLTQPRPLTTDEIGRRSLGPETVLLEYALGEPRSWVWVVTNGSVTGTQLSSRTEIEAASRSVHALLAERPSVRRERKELRSALTALSCLVLQPVGPLLGSKRLVVVGDGALLYVPFAVLPDPDAPEEPLIARHEVIGLPSASVLVALREERSARAPSRRTLAVFADPVFDARDERLGRARSGGGGAVGAPRTADRSLERAVAAFPSARALPRLPFTRREALAILPLVPADQRFAAFDFAANRPAAVRPEIGEYRYLHFATHGFLNSRAPELSGIVLSLVNSRGGPEAGFLAAPEVFNLRLSAELVVLSGCRTALGEEVKGEGLVGLTRAFMYAGAARLIASLWAVDDAATAELMARMYRGILGEGLSPASALRAAQRDLAGQRRWKDPYYWAAFELQGEWE